MNEDLCPDSGTCKGCGIRCCYECGDDFETEPELMCRDCLAEGDAA